MSGVVVGMLVTVASSCSGFVAGSNAAPWSVPRTLVAGAPLVGDVSLAASPGSDGAVAAWRSTADVRVARIGADGRPGRARLIGTAAEEAVGPQVAIDRGGVAVVVWYAEDYSLRVRRVGARGRLGPVRLLAPAYEPGPYNPPDVSVAIDQSGAVTVAWARVMTESEFPKGARVVSGTAHVRRVASNGSLGPTVDLPLGGGVNRDPRVAVDRHGRATVAWVLATETGDAVRAIRIGRRGRIGTPLDLVSPRPSWVAERPELAVDAAGNAVVVWRSADDETRTMTMARRVASDGGLGPTRVLGEGSVPLPPRIVVDARGRGTVVWRDASRDDAVQARQLSPDGDPGPLLTLATGAAADTRPDLAVDRGGNVTVIWSEGSDSAGDGDPTGVVRARGIGPRGGMAALETLRSRVGTHALDPRVVAGGSFTTVAWRAWARSSGGIETASKQLRGLPGPRRNGR